MPSGSHGGGGGSHGGGSHGGGSHGGSHFGGGRGGMGRPPRPIRIHFWGRHYVVRMGASRCISFLVVLLFFAIFGIFVSSVLFSSAKKEVRSIQQDYLYYQDMVAYAEQHPDHQVTGTVITKYYKASYDKWYITYWFETNTGERVEGYTFSVYTFDEVRDIRAGDPILLAIDGLSLGKETDSVPMDYGDMPIDRDGEYQMFLSQRYGSKIALIVCISVAGGIVAISLLTALLNKVKVQEHPNTETDTPKLNTYTEDDANTTHKKHTYCQYCGAEMDEGKKKCNNCGASQQ